ncbi:MAG: thymidylate kinase [Acidobacteria bacterium]|nr:MAG: thymidylate kinase [Acidobacteriota bacterium]
MSNLNQNHNYPGKLIIAEGIDGSGKTTQMILLQKWLLAQGRRVFFTEWNSSPLVKKATKEGKKTDTLTPTTFSLLHATDFADRLNYQIVPPLKAGMIVIADRYAYTAFGRDTVRGVHPLWVRMLYQFAIKPDGAFYFKVPIEVSLERLLSVRMQLKYYEAGMDLRLSKDVVESFRLFQSRILQEYDRIVEEFGLKVIDGTKTIQEQQNEVREITSQLLEKKNGRL